MGATQRSDYALPECFLYPIRFRRGGKVRPKVTAKHVRLASQRFSMHKGKYPKPQRDKIARAITAAKKRYGIGEFRAK
jgi:hypothetical protein